MTPREQFEVLLKSRQLNGQIEALERVQAILISYAKCVETKAEKEIIIGLGNVLMNMAEQIAALDPARES